MKSKFKEIILEEGDNQLINDFANKLGKLVNEPTKQLFLEDDIIMSVKDTNHIMQLYAINRWLTTILLKYSGITIKPLTILLSNITTEELVSKLEDSEVWWIRIKNNILPAIKKYNMVESIYTALTVE